MQNQLPWRFGRVQTNLKDTMTFSLVRGPVHVLFRFCPKEERVLAAGDRACAAARAATLRSTLSGVPSVPELLVISLDNLWDLRPSFLLSLRSCLSCLSFVLERSELRSRSLPEDVARDRDLRRSAFWELTLRVLWLLLLLLLLGPPSSPSLLTLLQALLPRDEGRASLSPSFPPEDFLLSFSSALVRRCSTARGGTSDPGHWRVDLVGVRLG